MPAPTTQTSALRLFTSAGRVAISFDAIQMDVVAPDPFMFVGSNLSYSEADFG